MKVRLHPEAEAEMIEAAAYYEAQQADLGKRFLASVQDAINSILIRPRLYPVVDLDVRRCLTKVFPFGVLFRGGGGQSPIMDMRPAQVPLSFSHQWCEFAMCVVERRPSAGFRPRRGVSPATRG